MRGLKYRKLPRHARLSDHSHRHLFFFLIALLFPIALMGTPTVADIESKDGSSSSPRVDHPTGKTSRALKQKVKSMSSSNRASRSNSNGVRAFVLLDSASTRNTRLRGSASAASMPPSARKDLRSKLSKKKIKILRDFEHVPAMVLEVSSEDTLTQLEQEGVVAKIDLDVPTSAALSTSVPQIGAHYRHAATYTGEGVTVAVLDTGIDTDHPDLADRIVHQLCFLDIDGAINGVGLCPNNSDRQSGPGSAEDIGGHGTHVAGIVASSGTTTGAVGMAPNASIVAVKVLPGGAGGLQTGMMSDVVAALDYLASNPQLGVDVVNMSLGSLELFNGDCDSSTAYNAALKIAIDSLRAQGMVVIASAGNNGSKTHMVSPACLSNVISVANIGQNDNANSESNWTLDTDIAAPGGNIVSTYVGGGTSSLTGTSMSAPHAAGMAAILIESEEAITPAAIETRLKQSNIMVELDGVTIPRVEFPVIDFDQDNLFDDEEFGSCTQLVDADSDEDGVADGAEDTNGNGQIELGESDPCLIDTDFDGIADGTERGVAAAIVDQDPNDPIVTTDPNIFKPDLDPSDTTNPTSNDSDNDGIADGDEDVNANGQVDTGETDPAKADTDGDGVPDGVELGIDSPVRDPDVNGPAIGTIWSLFDADEDLSTRSDPLNPDTDGDGIPDGVEDSNKNGAVDGGESHPNSLFDNGIVAPKSLYLDDRITDVVIADFNNDGFKDLVSTSHHANSVTLFVNDGKGNFDSGTETYALGSPDEIVAGDINNDGYYDLIYTGSYYVTTRTNNGAGGFDPPVQIPLGDQFYRLAYGDINNDGIGDIVASSKSASDIKILIGDAGGSFSAPFALPRNGKYFNTFRLFDFDSDGHLDIIATITKQNIAGNFIEILISQGDGTFTSASTLEIPGYCNSIVPAHLNADDQVDFTCLSVLHEEIIYLFSDGNGGYADAYVINSERRPKWLDIVDINADGYPDTLTSGVYVWRGNAGREYPVNLFYPVFGEGIANTHADLDGDGRVDLVLFDKQTINIVYSRYGGDINIAEARLLPEEYFAFSKLDIYNDGVEDLVFLNTGDDRLEIFLGDENSTNYNHFANISTGDLPTLLRTIRFNADDVDDLFVYNYTAGTFGVFLGTGDNFAPIVETEIPGYPREISFADIDGDQIIDVGIYTNANELTLLKGVADGSFSDLATLEICADRFKLIDVNNDGIVDIVAECISSYQAEVYLGNNNGSYEADSVIQFGLGGAGFLEFFDVDDDLDLDLITSGARIYLNNDGVFSQPVELENLPYSNSAGFKFHDMNNDSRPDLVSGGVSVLINSVDGYFQEEISFRTSSRGNFELLDANSDSLTDVVQMFNLNQKSYLSITLNNFDSDPDGDSIPTAVEDATCMKSWDADSDDDGISDGQEDKNGNGEVDPGETDPCNVDTDGDGIQDGTEFGLVSGVADPDGDGQLAGTDLTIFVADADPSTTSNALNDDSDNDGLLDRDEDPNFNGATDEGETDINDPDTDGDGFEDGVDIAPLDPAVPENLVTVVPTTPGIFLLFFMIFIIQRSLLSKPNLEGRRNLNLIPPSPQLTLKYKSNSQKL